MCLRGDGRGRMEAQTAFSVGETMLAGEPGYKQSSQGKLANLNGDFERRPTCKVMMK